jgi:hypothetical protein
MKLGRGKKSPSPPAELPERGATVTLSMAAGTRLPGRIMESSPDVLLIVVTVPIRPLTDKQLGELVLEYNSKRGRMRLRGLFSMEEGQSDVVRLQDPRSVEVVQQRDYVRIRSARPVLVYSGKAGQVQSFTVDLSGGGFQLAGPDTLRLGEEVRFSLTLTPGVTPVTGTARVVRVTPEGRRAVAFESISDLDRRRLVRFIFECQRDERRRGLNGEA